MKQTTINMIILAGLATATLSPAQSLSRQATIVGGGSWDQGKCTIEVVVDGAAQVEIRGSSATLSTLSGRRAQWRRFECTGALPPNADGFRFAGVDGRGRQSLVRDPRSNGGAAVVQLEDRDGGNEGYTFDIFWNARSAAPPPQAGPSYGFRPNYRDTEYYRRYHHGFGTDEAVALCTRATLEKARRRFRSKDIHMGRVTLDDGPGRQDWVTGFLDVHRRGYEERFRFSCSVDFNLGAIRTAEIEARPLPADPHWR